MWVARDKDGTLMLFNSKPIRALLRGGEIGRWTYSIEGNELHHIDCMELDFSEFLNLKWEDEPIEVELVKCKVGDKPYNITSLKNVGKYFEVENCHLPQEQINFYLSKNVYTKEYYSVIRTFVEKDLVIIHFEYKLPNEDRLRSGVVYIDCIATLDEAWNNYFKKIYVDSEASLEDVESSENVDTEKRDKRIEETVEKVKKSVEDVLEKQIENRTW